MKRFLALTALVSAFATSQAQSVQTSDRVTAADLNALLQQIDSHLDNYERLQSAVAYTYGAEVPGKVHLGHQYVDLGLKDADGNPVYWATCNVGAAAPENYGGFFAWGETKTKSTYDWSTYALCEGTYLTLTKYCDDSYYGELDGKTVLEPEDDAAAVNWGGRWRMPTAAEQDALRTKCTWTWTTLNNVVGCNVVGPNGNSIFLPAAGLRGEDGSSSAGTYGFYRSSSLKEGSPTIAYSIFFGSVSPSQNEGYRYAGFSVRAVCQ